MTGNAFVFDGHEVRLIREEGESGADHFVRQAEHDVMVANRAREIALLPALARRERALRSIAAAEAALADPDDGRQDWLAARLRRLARKLDWSA